MVFLLNWNRTLLYAIDPPIALRNVGGYGRLKSPHGRHKDQGIFDWYHPKHKTPLPLQ
jgi:hypothetical protein